MLMLIYNVIQKVRNISIKGFFSVYLFIFYYFFISNTLLLIFAE